MTIYNILKEGPVDTFWWDGVTTYDDTNGPVQTYITSLEAANLCCYSAQIVSEAPLLENEATAPDMGSTPPS